MKKIEKIGIAIVFILIVVFVLVLVATPKIPKNKVYCQTACLSINEGQWTYTQAPGPLMKNLFSSKEDCISACKARIHQ